MKNIVILLAALFVSASMGLAQNSAKTAEKKKDLPEITFEKTVYDFGTVTQGDETIHEFVFKNTGKAPLVLNNVRASCGCTVPNWSKKPVKQKEKASVKVRYDSNRIGAFTKSITVMSNAKNSPIHLTIKGEVIRKK